MVILVLFILICLFYSPLYIIFILVPFKLLSSLFNQKKALKAVFLFSLISLLLGIIVDYYGILSPSYIESGFFDRVIQDIFGVYIDMHKASLSGEFYDEQLRVLTNINLLNFGIIGVIFCLLMNIKHIFKKNSNETSKKALN